MCHDRPLDKPIMPSPPPTPPAHHDTAHAGPITASRPLLRAAPWALAVYLPLLVVVEWRYGQLLKQFDPPWLPMGGLRCFAGVALLTLWVLAAPPLRRIGTNRPRVVAAVAIAGLYVVAWTLWVGWGRGGFDLWHALVGWAAAWWVAAVVLGRPDRPWAVLVWGARLGSVLALGLFVWQSIANSPDRAGFVYYWPDVLGWGKLDKTAHFYAGLGLTLLLLLAEPLGAKRRWLAVALTVPLMLTAQPVMEWVQTRFGRGAERLDVISHSLGVAAALGAFVLLRVAVRLINRGRSA